MLALTGVGTRFKQNLHTTPHAYLTLLLVALALALLLLALLPGRWWLKVAVAAWVILP